MVNDVSSLTWAEPWISGQLRVSWAADLAGTIAAVPLVLNYSGLGTQLISLVQGISALQPTGSGTPFQGWAWQRRIGPARTVLKASSATGTSSAMGPTMIGGYSALTIQTVFNQQLALATAMTRPTPAATAPAQLTANQNAIAGDVIRRAALIIQAAGAFSAMLFESAGGRVQRRATELAGAIDSRGESGREQVR